MRPTPSAVIAPAAALPVMLDAIVLLEEIWELRPLGITTPWLVVLLGRGQVFPLA
ncbi:hypothetical protein BKA56DRAFT_592633 [Ilyonectria sp. MPI-CAGE-AT-0026]|nr:hypothetical protein BKA56DRAFT_592633 [Ilyonectria sp. MPI-CAGE-AT-0026]